jgi:hypothetical protein
MKTIKCASSFIESLLCQCSPLGLSRFASSSMIKIVLYRGFETDIKLFDHLVGQHKGNFVDLLGNRECSVHYLDTSMLKTDDGSTRHQFWAEG